MFKIKRKPDGSLSYSKVSFAHSKEVTNHLDHAISSFGHLINRREEISCEDFSKRISEHYDQSSHPTGYMTKLLKDFSHKSVLYRPANGPDRLETFGEIRKHRHLDIRELGKDLVKGESIGLQPSM